MNTILDVEKRSGVSRSTISRYLNGKKINEDNRIKIEQAIKDLHYHRNPMAIGLRTKKTKIIGVVLPSISDPFFPRLVLGLQDYIHKHGYQTIINSSEHDAELEIEQVETFMRMRVDGLVVASVSTRGNHIKKCLDAGVPVVLLDRLIEGFECDSVSVDNYTSTFDAITLCIKSGHRKIAFLGSGYYTDMQRFKGLRDALKQEGIDLPEEYIAWARITEHDSSRQFMNLLNLKDPPSLVFCSNIYHTLGVFETVVRNNISVPDEISVVSFDRLSSSPFYEFAKCIRPEFASICQPHEQISIETAKLLLKRISGGMDNYSPVNMQLTTSFFMSDSVADLK